jgi:CBS domain-containing protein
MIKAYLFDTHVGMLAIAADCESPFVSVDVEDSLALALERMAQHRYQQLPVERAKSKGAELESGNDRLVGLISYDDLLQAYSRELSQRRRVHDESRRDSVVPVEPSSV